MSSNFLFKCLIFVFCCTNAQCSPIVNNTATESLGEQRFSWGDIGNAIATFTGAIITTAGNEISKGGKHLQETAGTGSPPVALPTEMGDGDAAADTPEVTTIGFKESIGIVQAKHNDKIVFFQNGQVFSKNTGAKGDTDATDQCKNLCAKTVWCLSCDINLVRGECSLSRTVMGGVGGGPKKVDVNSAYYEKL